MVLERPGCFLPLAAEPLSAARSAAVAFAPTWTTSPRKTRVGFSRRRASGRLSRRRRVRSMFTPASRACGYRTASGRAKWPNRDPIGEAGGRNLYGFVRNNPIGSFDTDGRMEVSSCETALKRALESNAKAKKLVAELKKRKCPEPEPACKCCSAEERGGGFDPTTKKVKICANAWTSGAGIISAVVHELTHALDDCKGTDWSKCKERACSEIRAYDQGGSCASGGLDRQPGESYRECIKRKATASTTADPSCTEADVESQMDACLGSEL